MTTPITNETFLHLLQLSVAQQPDPHYRLAVEEVRMNCFVVTVDDLEGRRVGRYLVDYHLLVQNRLE